jgi:polysaccharide export outer membrane protein
LDSRTATSWIALLVLVLLLAAAPALSRAAGAADPSGSYRIGAGDVVDVQVWREPDLSGRYTIDAAGMLPHVLAGPVPAGGSTLAEVSARLRESLEGNYLREARVAVALVESARSKASVLGAVARPGLYPLSDGTRLLELLFAAGGATEAASGRATVLRFGPGGQRGASSRPRSRVGVDLAALLRGELAHDVALEPGDVVVVEAREGEGPAAAEPVGRVRVVGEVERPGAYPLSDAATVLDALLAAGGLTDYAAANRARVVRGQGDERSDTRVRLGDLMKGSPGADNLELRDGDLLVVPESFF